MADADVEEAMGSVDRETAPVPRKKSTVAKKSKQKRAKVPDATQPPHSDVAAKKRDDPLPSDPVGDKSAFIANTGRWSCNSVLMRCGVPLAVRARIGRSVRSIQPQRRRVLCLAGVLLSFMSFLLAGVIVMHTGDEETRFTDEISIGLSRASEELDHLGRAAVAAAGTGSALFRLPRAHHAMEHGVDKSETTTLGHRESEQQLDAAALGPVAGAPAIDAPVADAPVADEPAAEPPAVAPVQPVSEAGSSAGEGIEAPGSSGAQKLQQPGDGKYEGNLATDQTHRAVSDPGDPNQNNPEPKDRVREETREDAFLSARNSASGGQTVGTRSITLAVDASSQYNSHGHEQVHKKEYRQVMEIWSHDGDRDSPVCRFHSACLGSNGAVLLPVELKNQESRIALCGIQDPVFSIPSESSTIEDLPAELGEYVLDRDTSALDLLVRSSAMNTFSSDQPQFLQNLMAVLLAAETTSGEPDSLFSYECINGTRNCHGQPFYQQFFPTTVLSSELAATKVDTESWTGSLLDSLQSAQGLGMSYFAHEKLFPASEGANKAACFHTITTTRLDGSDLPAGLMSAERHAFMREESILSSPSVSKHAKPRTADPNKCHITFTVLQKSKSRELRNAYRLKTTLLAQGEETLKSTFPSADIKVVAQITPYETTGFAKIVAAMRATDVLVAPHCDGLSNSMFMMPNTSVIEVFPFGLILPTYQNFNKLRNINHYSVVAEPQTKTFKNCLKHANTGDMEGSSALLQAWEAAVEDFKTGNSLHALALEKPDTTTVEEAVTCALEQVLEFDVEEIAKKAVDEAVARCKGALGTI